jgi:ATP-binding cassette subfamily F protein 3
MKIHWNLNLQRKVFHGKILLEAKDLSFGYIKDKILFSNLTFSVGKNDRIGIIGRNGSGKSTLLRALTSDLTPLTGSVSQSPGCSLSYFGQTNVDRLNKERTIEEEIASAQPNLGRTAVRAICGTMMFEGDLALKKISVLSGGEKSRVLLGRIIATPSNLLLLDEPTNHLDMDSIESLIESLEIFDGALMIVSHEEEILHRLCNRLIVFQGGRPFVFEGTYQDFLDKIGWSDTEEEFKEELKSSKPAVQVGGTKQSEREKSANLKKINKLQLDIEKLEKELSLLSGDNLDEAQKMHELQTKIDSLLEELVLLE